MAPEEMDYEKWLAGVVRDMGEDGDTKISVHKEPETPLASALFPSLRGNDSDPIPPPTPERDAEGYDRNNWSRLLRQAKDMRPEIAGYLETLYQTGLGLELKKVKVKGVGGEGGTGKGSGGYVVIEKFIFTPGSNENWDERRIQEVLSSLYTYMMYLPARKELGAGSQGGQGHPVVQAMEAAIAAGGLLAVGPSGLKFDWGRAKDQGAVDKARGMMDRCGAEIMGYVRMAERGLRDIGFVVGLAEFCDCVG
ncbi:MAG: hypothetical protein VR68_11770 [Peptococcaceae bacterium BRH_c4a]|nr:MAG: hypothetical protein VR68_11770 [Peptococcaceae bacterium BRH_c4a]